MERIETFFDWVVYRGHCRRAFFSRHENWIARDGIRAFAAAAFHQQSVNEEIIMARFGPAALWLLSGTLFAGAAHASCGVSVCSAQTGWGVQSANDRRDMGSLLDLRLEYIDQNRLRSGSNAGPAASSCFLIRA